MKGENDDKKGTFPIEGQKGTHTRRKSFPGGLLSVKYCRKRKKGVGKDMPSSGGRRT